MMVFKLRVMDRWRFWRYKFQNIPGLSQNKIIQIQANSIRGGTGVTEPLRLPSVIGSGPLAAGLMVEMINY